MDYLVLHTPEDQLPNALREKKQQQRPPPTNPNMGGAVLVPKNQKAFLAPPIVVLPGMTYKRTKATYEHTKETTNTQKRPTNTQRRPTNTQMRPTNIVVLPGMASRSAEMQAAQQTVVLPAMLKPKEERQVQELVSMGFDRGQVLHLSQLSPISPD